MASAPELPKNDRVSPLIGTISPICSGELDLRLVIEVRPRHVQGTSPA